MIRDRDIDIVHPQLVERMVAGDPDALAELMRDLGGTAFSLALRITQARALAEEAVQDAFVALWRTARDYDPHTGPVEAWVLRYVRNKAIDRVRYESRRRPRDASGANAPTVDVHEVDIVDAAPASDPVAAAWIGSQADEVNQALGELSAEQRQVLELAYFDGLSQSEIASTTNIPLGTVKARTTRALARLRDVLAARGIQGANS